MAEVVNDRKVFSLLEVTQSIQRTIADRYKSSFWVKAELIKLNYYKHSGHCYPDLAEKKNGVVIAQMRANLWKDDFLRANKKFIEILKEPLKDGIKILFLAKISFEPSHGLALRILEIDPGYTLGDLEQEKLDAITKLKSEGVFDQNKRLALPLLPKRIAIISVETSKGYADFLSVIDKNPWNYRFFHFLFASVLQGENAVTGIISQLERIKKVVHHFDLVAIIRGGGGDVGLSCYNNYHLAKAIASFPLPVISGIGHATNETVAEMVSFTNAITPTKLAEYLIQKFHNFSVPVQHAEEILRDKCLRLLMDEKNKFQSEIKLFRSVTTNLFLKSRNKIDNETLSLDRQAINILKMNKEKIVDWSKSLISYSRFMHGYQSQKISLMTLQLQKESNYFFRKKKESVEQVRFTLSDKILNRIKINKTEIAGIERNINNMDPVEVLKRGFSITRLNGKSVHLVNQVKSGDVIETRLSDGTIQSEVK